MTHYDFELIIDRDATEHPYVDAIFEACQATRCRLVGTALEP